MNTQEIADSLAGKGKGNIFTIITERAAKVRKGCTLNIVKKSVMQGMNGTDYANRKPVREALENGERDEVELPGHIKESFYVGNTRFWRGHKGNEYFPICITGNKPKTTWLLDGKEVAFDDIKEHLLASEYPKPVDKDALADKGQAPFIAVSLDNVLAIH